jgi:hypothetical protein
MMINKTTRVALLVLGVIAVSTYFSDEEYYGDNGIESDLSIPIRIGRKAAFALYLGDKDQLHKIFDMAAWPNLWRREPAFTKVAIDSLSEQWIDKYQHMPTWIWIPALLPSLEDIELVTLDRLGVSVVSTYAYTHSEMTPSIPGKGRLLFAICLRYYSPAEHSLLGRLTRRLANAWFIPDFISREYGTTGRWIAYDFRLNQTQSEYCEWFTAHGEEFAQQQRQETLKTLDSIKTSIQNWKEFGKDALDFYDTWSTATAEDQIRRVECIMDKEDKKLRL